jgi:hypothetical protein
MKVTDTFVLYTYRDAEHVLLFYMLTGQAVA